MEEFLWNRRLLSHL